MNKAFSTDTHLEIVCGNFLRRYLLVFCLSALSTLSPPGKRQRRCNLSDLVFRKRVFIFGCYRDSLLHFPIPGIFYAAPHGRCDIICYLVDNKNNDHFSRYSFRLFICPLFECLVYNNLISAGQEIASRSLNTYTLKAMSPSPHE
jgi:hypothetical protein